MKPLPFGSLECRILNGRKINKKFVFEGEQVAIDNVDNVEYESLCGHCYFNFKNEK